MLCRLSQLRISFRSHSSLKSHLHHSSTDLQIDMCLYQADLHAGETAKYTRKETLMLSPLTNDDYMNHSQTLIMQFKVSIASSWNDKYANIQLLFNRRYSLLFSCHSTCLSTELLLKRMLKTKIYPHSH